MKNIILAAVLISVTVSAHAGEEDNYWLFDWDRMVVIAHDNDGHSHNQFHVSGQMLLSSSTYTLSGVVCTLDKDHCIDIFENYYIESVGPNSLYAELGDGSGDNSKLVHLFNSGMDMIVAFPEDIREFKHFEDYAELPELEYGRDGISVHEAVHELIEH